MPSKRLADYPSRRQLVARLVSSSISTLLLSGGSSLPSLANFTPYQIYSPGNVFVGRILTQSGDATETLQPVLILDTLDLDWELASYEEKLVLANLSSQRLADEYITQFVTGPIKQLIESRKEDETFAQSIFDTTQDLFKAGLNVGAADVKTAESHLNNTSAQKFSAIDALTKKNSHIAAERAKNDAEKTELREKIRIVKTQIHSCSILSPRAGTIQLHVAEGVFVERGDLLFEVK
jgi:multidrug resistance efflux pump